LGVISLNYNTFEHYLFAIFAHHLQRMGVWRIWWVRFS
jgi:hypothetical protein